MRRNWQSIIFAAVCTGLCWRCHKDAERQLAAEAEERRQEFLLSQHDAAAEDRGYGKVQQARDESRWK
jgi:hypothetical protein